MNKIYQYRILATVILALVLSGQSFAQKPQSAKVELGSTTAKNGFKNEDEIRDKFNNWKTDEEAKIWLGAMNYKLAEIESVVLPADLAATGLWQIATQADTA